MNTLQIQLPLVHTFDALGNIYWHTDDSRMPLCRRHIGCGKVEQFATSRCSSQARSHWMNLEPLLLMAFRPSNSLLKNITGIFSGSEDGHIRCGRCSDASFWTGSPVQRVPAAGTKRKEKDCGICLHFRCPKALWLLRFLLWELTSSLKIAINHQQNVFCASQPQKFVTIVSTWPILWL